MLTQFLTMTTSHKFPFQDEYSQLCVYVHGVKVVDLWGSIDPDNQDFNADSLLSVFSNTKTVTAIVMAMAVDRGWLAYNDPIAKHWPEFAQKGKDGVTVADLMRHESGLSRFPEPVHVESLQPDNIKRNAVGHVIEGFKQQFREKGRKRYYHTMTRSGNL